MRSRSQILLLTMAAAHLEKACADEKLVTDLKRAAGLLADKRSRGERATKAEAAENDKRIECQRALFGLLPNGSDKDRLKQAMLQRAYDLLWDGDCMGCDALTEFLPGTDVEAMLDAWSQDQFETPRSPWYGGNA